MVVVLLIVVVLLKVKIDVEVVLEVGPELLLELTAPKICGVRELQ